MKDLEINRLLLSVLKRNLARPAPVWLMRQAGRYLPEYQATRKSAGSFWTMCMTPDLAVEVTLQPIRRFDFDAAILFSDILVIPHALGQGVKFEDGHGPMLEAYQGLSSLVQDKSAWLEKLSPVYEAMRKTRAGLAKTKALIGFAGAPWTLAAYMLEGKGSPDQRKAKLAAYRDSVGFGKLLSLLSEAVAWHLVQQVEAGADVVQIFDSWAGGLPYREFEEWVLAPNRRIVEIFRAQKPNIPIIGFPRAVSQLGYETYAESSGVDAICIDTATPMEWAVKALGPKVVLQGNLDPIVLIAGGDALDRAIDHILNVTRATPFIFNLGHGILPETPLEHVAQLISRIRSAA